MASVDKPRVSARRGRRTDGLARK